MSADVTAVLTAKTDQFESSLARAAKASEDTARSIQSSTDKINTGFSILKDSLQGLAAGLTVGAFVGLVKGAIDAADHLNDLSKKTGIAVETLGGFGFAAEQAGGSLDSIAKGLVKLDLSLSQAAAGNLKAKEGFDLLGVSVKNIDGSTRSAAQVLPQLADKFAAFNDGPEKAALAVRLFGKAGADLIPVLDDGGRKLQENVDYFQRYSGVTAELAEKSDAFNDTLTKLSLLSGAFGKQLAAELLPTLQALADLLVESKEKGTAFQTVAEGIGVVFRELVVGGAEVVTVFTGVGRELGGFAAKVGAIATLDFSGFRSISSAMREDEQRAEKDLDGFRARIRGAGKGGGIDLGFGDSFDDPTPKKDAPRLASTGTSKTSAAVDIARKLLDQQLKDLDIYIAQEKERYADESTFLSLAYQQNNVSLTDYFDGRRTARDRDLANVQDAYAKEIEAQRAYIATLNQSDPKGQAKAIDAQTKIAEIQEKARKSQHDGAIENAKDAIARTVAVEKYADELAGLQAQVETLRGNTAKAFAITFDIQTNEISKKIDLGLQSNDPATRQAAEAAKQNVAEIRQQGLVQATVNERERERSTILLELQNVQERINLKVQSGQSTELEGLAALSTANRSRIEDLRKVIDAEQALVAFSDDPKAAAARVDALRVELEKLSAQTDLVADKFRSIGESATENFLDKITSGTASAKDAFKALVSDVNKELLKIGNKELSQQIFKKDGAIGTFISSLTGGGSSKDGAASAAAGAAGTAGTSAAVAANDAAFATLTASITASDASLTALTVTTPTLDAAFATLAASSTVLAAALEAAAASAAGKAGSDAVGSVAKVAAVASAKGNIFDMGSVIPFARGDVFNSPTLFPMSGGKTGLLGEAGPEAIVPLRRGRNGQLGISSAGGQQQTINYSPRFSIPPGTSTETQMQIASKAQAGARRAFLRNS